MNGFSIDMWYINEKQFKDTQETSKMSVNNRKNNK